MSIAERLIAQGRAQGEACGKLMMLQEMMDLHVSSRDELDALSTDELQARFQELQLQYEAQFKNR